MPFPAQRSAARWYSEAPAATEGEAAAAKEGEAGKPAEVEELKAQVEKKDKEILDWKVSSIYMLRDPLHGSHSVFP
jgi:molecular chaperone GrpE